MGGSAQNTQYTTEQYTSGSVINLSLSKKVYGLNGALNTLDEEFNEFNIPPKSFREFFTLWNTYFYDIKRNTHSYFLGRSTNYAYPDGMPTNERLAEIQELEEQLRELQRQIDSKEREHFFIKNHVFIILEGNDRLGGDNQISTKIGENIGPYYMQSGKKRLISTADLYYRLKTKTRKYGADILDRDFLIFLNSAALNGISDGPPITGDL